jgi:hypothetical protein
MTSMVFIADFILPGLKLEVVHQSCLAIWSEH